MSLSGVTQCVTPLGKNENFKQLKSMGYNFWLLFPLSPPEYFIKALIIQGCFVFVFRLPTFLPMSIARLEFCVECCQLITQACSHQRFYGHTATGRIYLHHQAYISDCVASQGVCTHIVGAQDACWMHPG
jgi:hypothetical protein